MCWARHCLHRWFCMHYLPVYTGTCHGCPQPAMACSSRKTPCWHCLPLPCLPPPTTAVSLFSLFSLLPQDRTLPPHYLPAPTACFGWDISAQSVLPTIMDNLLDGRDHPTVLPHCYQCDIHHHHQALHPGTVLALPAFALPAGLAVATHALPNRCFTFWHYRYTAIPRTVSLLPA